MGGSVGQLCCTITLRVPKCCKKLILLIAVMNNYDDKCESIENVASSIVHHLSVV